MVVDDSALHVFLGEKHALVIGNRHCEGFVRDGGVDITGRVKSGNVVPVPCKTLTAPKLALRAEHMDRSGFLPERAFRAHHVRRCGGEFHRSDVVGRIAVHEAPFAGLAGGSRAEFQHHSRRHVA